jgi:hypothetical protein
LSSMLLIILQSPFRVYSGRSSVLRILGPEET